MAFGDFCCKYGWWILGAVVVAVVVIIVCVYIAKRKKNTFRSIEHYTGTDDFAESFKYAESYVNSVLNL